MHKALIERRGSSSPTVGSVLKDEYRYRSERLDGEKERLVCAGMRL